MISQLNIFLENKPGRLSQATRTVGDAGINLHALLVADTSDFGVVRIITDSPARAAQVLQEAGFRASLTDVVAVKLDDVPGALASLLEFCESSGLNIEYAYCFIAAGGHVVDILKFSGDVGSIEKSLGEAGFTIASPSEIYEEA